MRLPWLVFCWSKIEVERAPMTRPEDVAISKFLALILRHKPDAIGITLDEHGWANVDELLSGLAREEPCDLTRLERIVDEDEKQRYSFNDDHTLIRANQGHSIPVDVELEPLTPPTVLYHGTGEKYARLIDAQGLLPKSRLYVHLSTDVATARKVGARHGKPVLYRVDSSKMVEQGYAFFRAVNGVWLTKRVPNEFLERVEDEE